ncbi:MAG: hypothetical protein IJK25_08235, partial [Firmicutes bacterium]|nr:hypothetical protein [Bacillota bacterium]
AGIAGTTVMPGRTEDSAAPSFAGQLRPAGAAGDTAGDQISAEAEGGYKGRLPAVWLGSVLLMLSYAAASFVRLKRQVAEAAPFEAVYGTGAADSLISRELRGRVYVRDGIPAPFILGMVRPKIYLPSGLSEGDIKAVIAHESAHLLRLDHWWKPLGFAVLSVHWFNPLVWISYALLCRDIELACDEKVIKALDSEGKKAYAGALLSCSLPGTAFRACPLAFGEVAVGDRVRAVALYKKPGFRLTLLACAVIAAAAASLLTDPAERGSEVSDWLAGDQQVLSWAMERFDIGGSRIAEGSFIETRSDDRTMEKDFAVTAEDGSRWLMTVSGPVRVRRSLLNGGVRVGPEMKVSSVSLQPYPEGLTAGAQSPAPSDQSGAPAAAEKAGTEARTEAVRWFDRMEDGSYPGGELRTALPEAFPDLAFIAGTESISVERDGIRISVIEGMPVWNAYFADLDGDGLPELAACVSIGSGIVDERVIVYDAVDGSSYVLADRGRHDYFLKEEDGKLLAVRTLYPAEHLSPSSPGEGSLSGELYIHDGRLMMKGLPPEYLDLETAIDLAVLRRNDGRLVKGAYPAEGHVILETETGKDSEGHVTLTVYMMTLYRSFEAAGRSIAADEGILSPAVLVFTENEDRSWDLAEYMEPGGGPDPRDARAMFPASIPDEDLDPCKWADELQRQCYEKAVRRFGVDTGAVIEGLINEIMYSPSWSSVPDDYIAAHGDEMRELGCYGDYTVQYILRQFLAGGQNGLKGHIMLRALNGMAGEEDKIGGSAVSVQELFDSWLDEAGRQYQAYGASRMKRERPIGWLALTLSGRMADLPRKTEAELLGLSGFYTEEFVGGAHRIRTYYLSGAEALGPAAESFGFEIDDVSRDLDGDGVPELICSCVYGGDGVRQVVVYRIKGKTVERGVINTELLGLRDWYDWGANSLHSFWDGEKGVFIVAYSTEDGEKTVFMRDLSAFMWEEFLRLDGSDPMPAKDQIVTLPGMIAWGTFSWDEELAAAKKDRDARLSGFILCGPADGGFDPVKRALEECPGYKLAQTFRDEGSGMWKVLLFSDPNRPESGKTVCMDDLGNVTLVR